VGTVWRPSHTRGSIQHGAVISDYICSPFPSSPKEGTSDA
jgi:hypothetical protein